MAAARRRAAAAPLHRSSYALPSRFAAQWVQEVPDASHAPALQTEPALPSHVCITATEEEPAPPPPTSPVVTAQDNLEISSSVEAPPEVAESTASLPVPGSHVKALAMPIYAPAPPLDGTHAANAYALINGETPWSAVAVCRQQAERLAKLEAEILEECRQKQERLWHGELEEVLDQKAQEWRQRHAELESQIFYQEQRYASAQVSWRQSEVACQRDAQMRCASAQDRCLAVSEELAELRSSAATERFEFQQDVGQLHTEVLTAAKEADTMKLEERTIITCMQQELSAEAASAAHLAQQAASQRDVAISECEAVEVTLRNQRFKHRSDLDELLLQRTSLEERCQHAEHLQRLAVQRASQEEELAANASEQREVAQVELAAESEGRDELSALVIGLKSEFEAAVKEMEVERETRREFQRASQEAQKLQSTFLAEALAAREVAEAAAVEIAEERRERARDLHEFRQVLQRHQEQLSAERQRQIFSELSGIIGASAD